MDKNIFLIGMPGAGKTFWGKKIATALHKDFFDLDFEIEKQEQQSILEIFRDDGEKFFREKESEVLRTFEQKQNLVLATGGGTPCFFENAEWMKKNGLTIWIDEPVSVLKQRLKTEKSQRPLIRGLGENELSHFLKHQLEERKPFFLKADYQIQSPVNLVEDILNKINNV